MAKSRPAKKGPRPPRPVSTPGMGGGRGNIQQQVAQLQEQMMQTQEALKDEQVTATAGGGVIKVVANGHQQVLSIQIAPEVVNPADVEMLQDMILAAVNEALEGARNLASERMSALTGGLNVPGLF